MAYWSSQLREGGRDGGREGGREGGRDVTVPTGPETIPFSDKIACSMESFLHLLIEELFSSKTQRERH